MDAEKKIKAVVFDVDGTLYPNYKMFLNSAFFFLIHPVVARTFRRVRKKVRELGRVGDLKQAQAFLFADYTDVPPEKAEKLISKYIYGTFISLFKWVKPFPYMKDVLSKLKRSGLKLGIISDFPIEKKLSCLGLDEYWDIAISADEIGFLKPDKYSFISAAEKLNIPPDEIIYVGNNYKYDIIGAVNAGMQTAHFSKVKVKNSLADITFSDYNGLIKYILEKNREREL